MQHYKTETASLWQSCPDSVQITAYVPTKKRADCAIVILPGGAYYFRAEHEGKGYAEFFAEKGILSFVVDYRCRTHRFPIPLMDARRGIQYVRYHAKKHGIDPQKIAIMGSSAGGHLAALTATCCESYPPVISDEIDSVSYLPNAQNMCYPVIRLFGTGITHEDSAHNLLGDHCDELAESLSPDLIATEEAPQAFIWHTFEDSAVNVLNSLYYAQALKRCHVPTELHVFPRGYHGLGLAKGEDAVSRHVCIWSDLLLRWLELIGFIS